MTLSRRFRTFAPLLGFSLLLLFPGAAVSAGLLPFDMRFAAIIIVAALCVACSLFSGYSPSELGLGVPWARRQWLVCLALTAALALPVVLEVRFLGLAPERSLPLGFLAFYVLVSSPCQEIVCRSTAKLVADRVPLSGRSYVVFSATVFSLMHCVYGDPVLLANTFVAGLAWGAGYLLIGNVWPLAASHAAIGALAITLGAA